MITIIFLLVTYFSHNFGLNKLPVLQPFLRLVVKVVATTNQQTLIVLHAYLHTTWQRVFWKDFISHQIFIRHSLGF